MPRLRLAASTSHHSRPQATALICTPKERHPSSGTREVTGHTCRKTSTISPNAPTSRIRIKALQSRLWLQIWTPHLLGGLEVNSTRPMCTLHAIALATNTKISLDGMAWQAMRTSWSVAHMCAQPRSQHSHGVCNYMYWLACAPASACFTSPSAQPVPQQLST